MSLAAAANFNTDGWKVVVDGLVHKPRSFTIDDLHAISRPEERVYRMRCVEAWSMVIPWAGVPLARLLETVEPMSNARYVAFKRCSIQPGCPVNGPPCWNGPTSRVCDWTRRCTL